MNTPFDFMSTPYLYMNAVFLKTNVVTFLKTNGCFLCESKKKKHFLSKVLLFTFCARGIVAEPP
jgi:hypothetical protein